MDWREILETSFLVAFWAGFAFSIASAVLSGAFHHEFGQGSAFGGGHATELGGPDIETGHFDSGSPHVGWADAQFPGASPLSPTVISAAVTALGGMGYLAITKWDFGVGGSVAIGIVASLVIGGASFFLLDLMFRKLQSTSHVSELSLVGTKALVQVPIESGQAGAIVLVAKGQRITFPAHASDAARVPAGAEVEIVLAAGGVFVVKETRESWLARSKSGSN